MYYLQMDSPVGTLWLAQEGDAITRIEFTWSPPEQARREETPLLRLAREQLSAYFAGRLKVFTLPLAPAGTPFQQAVWQALQRIPYGETRSYADVAREIGHPKAFRAVGGANHRNPISIIIPCHRVIGASGGLTGYGGGLSIKEALLALEKRNCTHCQ